MISACFDDTSCVMSVERVYNVGGPIFLLVRGTERGAEATVTEQRSVASLFEGLVYMFIKQSSLCLDGVRHTVYNCCALVRRLSFPLTCSVLLTLVLEQRSSGLYS
jgi:hypothetical protein